MSAADLEISVKYIRFQAGTRADPKPASNPREKRLARCVTCRTFIVHYSPTVARWIDDHFHTGHVIEFPEEWLP
jgi:hypothetical protein